MRASSSPGSRRPARISGAEKRRSPRPTRTRRCGTRSPRARRGSPRARRGCGAARTWRAPSTSCSSTRPASSRSRTRSRSRPRHPAWCCSAIRGSSSSRSRACTRRARTCPRWTTCSAAPRPCRRTGGCSSRRPGGCIPTCAFTSEIFYAGRLHARDGLERQAVRGPEPLDGSGLRLVAVEHAGNQSESPEEVEAVFALVSRALEGDCAWVDARGVERPLRLEDILVVAPYNAQVAALAARLPAGARVGTVDRFQGQEAPVVIYSMTSSSAEDAPRGMQFLYSPNRLNVATSRARCLAIVVASPRVFVPDCRAPEHMRLANAFCRFRELALG